MGQRGRKRPRSDTNAGGYRDGDAYVVEKKNVKFEEYYRRQGLCSDEEFERLTIALGVHEKVNRQIESVFIDAFGAMDSLEMEDGLVLRRPEQFKWYPDGNAWRFNVPRPVLKKNERLKLFKKFITTMNAIGAINRQEAVSMIPALLLDLHPGQKVIDMCAAPGSKTVQILDALMTGQRSNDQNLIVANDSDLKRCNLLCHQLKRFNCPDLLVTNHEAQAIPSIDVFDRVLCDVPCSGDGTLRKAPDMWRKWRTGDGHALHRIQVAIAKRGFQLLKPGGTMVYSTCSFNPIENEAVVAEMLRSFEGDIELVDTSERLPGLIRRKGLTSWAVRDVSDGEAWYGTFEEVPETRQRAVFKTMFPPSADEAQVLERCLRILPHDQDTGGFFVAVIRKVDTAEWPLVARREQTSDSGRPKSAANPGGKQRGKNHAGYANLLSTEPLGPIKELAPPVAEEIGKFFGIEAEVFNHVFCKRSDTQAKRLYYMPAHIASLMERSVYSQEPSKKLRVLSAGIRTFERCPRDRAACDYRIVYGSLSMLLESVRQRAVAVDREQFVQLLEVRAGLGIDKIAVSKARDEVRALTSGTIVFRLEGSSDAILMWRGLEALSPLMPTEDIHILCIKYDAVYPEKTEKGKSKEGAAKVDAEAGEEQGTEKVDAESGGEENAEKVDAEPGEEQDGEKEDAERQEKDAEKAAAESRGEDLAEKVGAGSREEKRAEKVYAESRKEEIN